MTYDLAPAAAADIAVAGWQDGDDDRLIDAWITVDPALTKPSCYYFQQFNFTIISSLHLYRLLYAFIVR